MYTMYINPYTLERPKVTNFCSNETFDFFLDGGKIHVEINELHFSSNAPKFYWIWTKPQAYGIFKVI